MDIDVKNALNKALSVCHAVEQNTGASVVQQFAMDVYWFVSSVSTTHAEERYSYFNKVYLDGKYPADDMKQEANGDIPASIRTVSQMYPSQISQNGNPASTLVAFFLILGRSYASSQFDRKDVSIDAVAEQVKRMNDYIGKQTATPANKKQSKKHIDSQTLSQKGIPNDSDEDAADGSIQEDPEESLDELLNKLNSLIGLAAVKQEVQQIINLIKVQKKGEEFGEKLPPLSLHLVFFGNPGTGKTTVARLLSKIYKCLGVLSSGQLVEVDRGGLVAGYVGQTAIKTQEVIDKAMGGILFIDEAYSLTHGKGETDFG